MTRAMLLSLPILLLTVTLLPILAEAQAPVEKRIALVVGNWAYAQAPLKNPENDVRDMERLLKKDLRFDEVIVEPNADPPRLKAAIRRFGESLERAAARAPGRVLALFYYSGHGVQSEGKNYLVPVGRRFDSEDDIEADAVEVQFVLDRMRRAGGGLNIVVLDACRDFPLRRRARSETRGLARIQPPQGSLIAYATEADATAYDNPGERNGLFTKHLLRRLAQADLDVDKALDYVSSDVYEEAKRQGREQTPEVMKKTWPVLPVYLLASGPVSPTPPAPRDDYPPGKVFRDCPDCPEMVVIPAGAFRMGSPEGEDGRFPSEGPQHTVRIGKAFAMGRTEVTVGEFRRFVEASGYRTSAERDAEQGCYAWDKSDKKWGWRSGRSWREPGYPQDERHPVVCASWEDARAYVQWLGKETGRGYRLPTEAEWEYAARAGMQTARFWGDAPDEACQYANVADQTAKKTYPDWTIHDCTDGYAQTAPVGRFQPNGFGLYDMLGNVWEWVQDCYHGSYAGAPADGSVWEGGKCEARVLRGGSWDNRPQLVRSAIRNRNAPSERDDDNGFRIARTLP
jgi:formylglycine-generating enzyme required for sulfatase activity